MSEDKLQAAISRGARAEALLNNDLLQEAFARLEQDYIEAWRISPARDTDGASPVEHSTRTSCPAPRSAQPSGTIGNRCPVQSTEVNSTRIASSFSRCPPAVPVPRPERAGDQNQPGAEIGEADLAHRKKVTVLV